MRKGTQSLLADQREARDFMGKTLIFLIAKCTFSFKENDYTSKSKNKFPYGNRKKTIRESAGLPPRDYGRMHHYITFALIFHQYLVRGVVRTFTCSPSVQSATMGEVGV